MNSFIEKSILIEENNKEYTILIGKNALGNEHIIKISHPNNYWFHFDNISGPHIILCNNDDIIPKKYLIQIANMLFEYKKHIPPKSTIFYTQINNLKLTSTPGTVIIKNNKKIFYIK